MRRRRGVRSGFIIIFGWRSVGTRENEDPVETVCPSCRQSTFMVGKRMRRWLTLFFIPVFPEALSKSDRCRALVNRLQVEQQKLQHA